MEKNFTKLISEVCKARQFMFATATLLLLIASAAYLRANVSTITVTGGSNFPASADLAANATVTTPGYTSFGSIVITEVSTGDFAVGSGTLTLTAPAGWAFKQSGVNVVASDNSGSTSNTDRNVTVNNGSIGYSATVITIPYTVDKTNKQDRVTISGLEVQAINGSNIPGTGQITINDGAGAQVAGLPQTLSKTLSQINGGARKLSFTTQPGGALTGAALNPQPVVTIQDQFGNTVSNGAGNNAAVTIAIGNNPAGSNGALGGTVTVNASAGIATFSNLSIDAAGTGYTLVASSGSLTSAISTAFNINSNIPTLNAPTACITEGEGSTTITLTGTNFEKNSIVQVNGSNRVTTFNNATKALQVTLLATDVATAGSIDLSVLNPAPPANNISNTQTLVINPVIKDGDITGPISVCAGTSATYTAPEGFTDYQWSISNSAGTITGQGTRTITINFAASASGDIDLELDATNACGDDNDIIFDIVVKPKPTLVATASDPEICVGESVTLNVSGAGSYVWTGTGLAPNTTGTSITVSPTATTTFTVVGTLDECESAPATVTVTVNPLPVATITTSGPISFCQGDSVTLTAQGGTSWLWSNNATTQSITVDADGTFTVQVTDGKGCTSAASEPVTVEVNPIPDVPAVSGDDVCGQGTVTLGATVGAGGTDVRWYTELSGGTSVATGSSYTTPNLTTTTTFYASSYNATTDCESERVAVEATVNPLPDATITVTGPTEFCNGEAIQLTGPSEPVGITYTYEWTFTDANGQVSSATGRTLTVDKSGSAIVKVINTSTGCEDISAPTEVREGTLEFAIFTYSGSTTFCEGKSLKLTGIQPPPGQTYTYSWKKDYGTANETEVSNQIDFIANESGIYRLVITETSIPDNCTKVSDPIQITVNPLPTADAGTDETKCFTAGGTVFALDGAVENGNGIWSIVSGSQTGTTAASIDNPNSLSSSVTVTGSGSITLRLTSNSNVTPACTSATDDVVLTVNPLPSAEITPSGTVTFCQGGSAVLTAPVGANYTYQWFNGTTEVGTSSSYTATTAGNYTVRVTNSVTGCVTTTAIPTTIVINPQPVVSAASASPAAKCVGAGNTTVFDLTGTVANETATEWSVAGTTGSASVSNISSPNTTGTQVTVNGVGTVTMRLTASSDVASCEDASKEVTLTVHPMPIANAGADQSVCQAASGVTLIWREGSGSGIGSNQSLDVKWTLKSKDAGISAVSIGYDWEYGQRVDITGVGSATLTMTVTTNGCSTSDDVVYTVKPTPVITAIGNKTYCNGAAGEAINFESSVSGSTITWTSSSNVGFGTSGTGNIPAYTATNNSNSTITTTVKVNATINGCSAAEKTFTITVYPTPRLGNIPANASICSQAVFSYIPTIIPSGANVTWSRASVDGISNAAASGSGSISETLINTTTTDKVVTYVYTITANGCSNTQNVNVTVKPKPQPQFTGVTDGQVFYSGDGSVSLTGQNPGGGSFSGTGVSGTTFNPCNAFNGVPASTTTVDVPITYTVNVNGCTGSVTKTVTVKRSTYTVVVTAVPFPFCRGDNVTYTTKVYRDITSIVYPYLVDSQGRPVYENGSFVPSGRSNLPVANPNYDYPAGTPEIIRKMGYRFFEPVVTGGTLVDPNSFTYQWHKNETVDRKNDGIITTDAGLSSMDYYGVYVTSKNASSCVPILSNQISDRKYSAEIEEYSINLTATPLCQDGVVNFTATLNSAFPYWSISGLEVELVRTRGSLVLATASYNGTNTFNFAINTAGGVLVNGDEVYIRFNSIIDDYRANSKCTGATNSNTVTIRIDQPVAITANLNPTYTQCEASNVTISVTASGSNLQYAWYKEGSATPLSNIAGKISGATTNAITISNLALADAGKYYVTVSNNTSSICSSTVTSNTAELIVNPLTKIATHPQGATVCPGASASFSASATGTNLTYQWYKGATAIQGATNPTYSIPSVVAADAGNYTVKVTGTCGELTSSVATLIVNEPVIATGNTSVITQCQGTEVEMNVNASGTGLIFEWFKDGVSIGNNNSKLIISDAQPNHSGNYSVKVTGTCTPEGITVAMNPLVITKNEIPLAGIQAENSKGPISDTNPMKVGESVTFTASTNIMTDDIEYYRWFVGDEASGWIPQSSTTNTLTIVVPDKFFQVKVEIGNLAGTCYTQRMAIESTDQIRPLPVEIIYFNAERRDNTVLLKWATAMEKNNEGFEVQVSQDGRNYRQLQFVETKNGNTSIKQTYEYTDKENGKYGTRYYRLKQLDSDGKFAYYGPQMVTFGDVSNKVFVYPNPFEREVKLDVDAEKDASMDVTITNIMGKQVMRKTIDVAQGRSTVALDLGENLPAGVYIITTRLNGLTTNVKLLKQ